MKRFVPASSATDLNVRSKVSLSYLCFTGDY